MSDIVNIIGILGGSYAGKEAVTTGISLLKELYGPSFKEKGEMRADEFRLRRVENSVKIMAETQRLLKESGLDPQGIPLKTMEPLLNSSSLEEDEDLQLKWSNLMANILTKDISMSLQQNTIDILSKISNEEVKLIDHIYSLHEEKLQKYLIDYPNNVKAQFNCDWYSYKVSDFYTHRELKLDSLKIGLCLSNLVAFGLIRWEIEVKVESAEAPNTYSGETKVDIDLMVVDDDYIKITKLGVGFVELCKFKNE